MKPGKHQTKLSKEKNPHFYNVASSYQHLIDNIGYDITGFVDKDMEKFITRGYDV